MTEKHILGNYIPWGIAMLHIPGDFKEPSPEANGRVPVWGQDHEQYSLGNHSVFWEAQRGDDSGNFVLSEVD